MVLEIRLSNFFSIKDEVVLDLRAGNIKTRQAEELSNNVFKAGNETLLKTVAIYGANASGKSNIIRAIKFCVELILNSHDNNQNASFDYKPFKFDGFPNRSSEFKIRFAAKGTEYEYYFSILKSEIFREELWFYPKGKRAKVFTREEREGSSKSEIYSFGPAGLIRKPMDVAESTSKKTLFLSRGSQMDRELLKQIFTFFDEKVNLGNKYYSFRALKEVDKSVLLEALKVADSDIVDINIEEEIKSLPIWSLDEGQEKIIEHYDERITRVKSKHRSGDAEFDFVTEESEGTKTMFLHLLDILDGVRKNKILFIDEIERSLHPKIVEYLINLFHSSNSAQLVFTTHNTHLLDLKKFRKDQIYFTNKKEDGSTDLYSLFDYKDFRETMDLEKAYLQGRFDAVPIVDDSPARLKELVG